MAFLDTLIKSEHCFSSGSSSAQTHLYRSNLSADISSYRDCTQLSSSHKGKMDRNNAFLMPPASGQQDASGSRKSKSRRHSPSNSASSRENSRSSGRYDRSSASPGAENQEQQCSDHLLRFKTSVQAFPLLDHVGRETSASITAELGGMFFLAESGLGDEDGTKAPATYLTCYRRNLFQVTGSVIIANSLRYIVTDQGARISVIGQELAITATESVEGNPVKLVSVPWKSTASEQSSAAESREIEPQVFPVEIPPNAPGDGSYIALPISWKRLQFRIATANNGRRKELQQHFLVHLRLNAILANGARVGVADARSDPIIVRGRSPRNFQSRKEFAVGGSSSRTSGRQSASASKTTSRGSSQTSGSPPNQSLDTFQAGTSSEMLSYQASPMLPQQHIFQNSAPPIAESQFIYDGQHLQLTPSYPAWGDNMSHGLPGTSTPMNEPLFSPMAEMYLGQTQPTGYGEMMQTVNPSSSGQAAHSSSGQQPPLLSDSDMDEIMAYHYDSNRNWQ